MAEGMTIVEAVVILNERKHNNTGEWKVIYGGELVMCHTENFHCALTRFEAIAVAEKYQRDDQEKARPNFPIPELNPRGAAATKHHPSITGLRMWTQALWVENDGIKASIDVNPVHGTAVPHCSLSVMGGGNACVYLNEADTRAVIARLEGWLNEQGTE